jgi:ATP-dependent Lon protease
MELDRIDQLAATAFDGYLVRKDLVRKYSRQYPIPTYVVEFLLGRYCATTNEEEIAEGLQIVEKQLQERTVGSIQAELFKARTREHGTEKLIDLVKAHLDSKNDCFLAELPSLNLRDVRIADALVHRHERMLLDGFYAEVTLEYDAAIALEQNGRPFAVESLRPIQLSSPDVLEVFSKARQQFTVDEWTEILIRSVGLEPDSLGKRGRWITLLRMVPYVERNYNLVELGPRGTGKSHLYQQISPYSHLVSGGKTTVAKLFVNLASGQRGLVCLYDVVCFDEVSGISFDQKEGVNIMKGYMASGEFSRGKEAIRADGSIVLVGNLNVDVQQQQRLSHLLAPLPPEMRNDTAFMDRIHAYIPGWDFPKINPHDHLTDHFGLVSDFLSECWNRLRSQSRVSALQGRIHWGGALSGRDIEAVNKTTSGLIKLLYPDAEMEIADEELEQIVSIALESRRRIKEQQKRLVRSEFRNTHFSYFLGVDGVEKFVATPELHSDKAVETDPLPPGQVWTISPGIQGASPSLYRIEATCGPGSSVKILNAPVPPGLRESVRYGEQNLYVRSKDLVGDRDPRAHEFSLQMRAMDADTSGAGLGLGILLALCSGLMERSIKGGLVIVGALNLGGSIEMVPNPVSVAELGIEKGAQTLLMPVSSRQQLFDLPDELATKVSIEFYSDAVDALVKAVLE